MFINNSSKIVESDKMKVIFLYSLLRSFAANIRLHFHPCYSTLLNLELCGKQPFQQLIGINRKHLAPVPCDASDCFSTV